MLWQALLTLVIHYVSGDALSAQEKTAILDKHNELRAAIVTPCSAADMETLVWDDTLASEASTYADGCVGDHAAGAGNAFGENLWMNLAGSSWTLSDITAATQEWYDEIVDVNWITDSNNDWIEAQSKSGAGYPANCQSPDYANNNCFIGHFTQIVWAKTNKIGCGIKACSPLEVSGTQYADGVLLVCRYTPAGNAAAAPNSPNHVVMPFLPGAKCAACPSATCGPVDGLCAAGATPIRCANAPPPYNFNNQDYQTCASYVAAMNALSIITDACTDPFVGATVVANCALFCGTCSVPANLGKDFCAAAPTTTTASPTTIASPTTASPTSVSPTTASPIASPTTDSPTTASPTTDSPTTAEPYLQPELEPGPGPEAELIVTAMGTTSMTYTCPVSSACNGQTVSKIPGIGPFDGFVIGDIVDVCTQAGDHCDRNREIVGFASALVIPLLTRSFTNPIVTRVSQASLAAGNDPVAWFGKESKEFWLPVGKLIPILHTRHLSMLASSFVGSPQEQWIDRIVVTNLDGFRLADIRIKKNIAEFNRSKSPTNAFETIDLTLGQSNAPLASMPRDLEGGRKGYFSRMEVSIITERLNKVFNWLPFHIDQVHIGKARREAVIITSPDARFIIISSPATEYYGDVSYLSVDYAHLDIHILDMKNRASIRGLLPELWGLKKMSNRTKAMTCPPWSKEANQVEAKQLDADVAAEWNKGFFTV